MFVSLRVRIWVCAFVASVASLACTPAASPKAEAREARVEFVDDWLLAPGVAVGGLAVGGLSALALDPATGRGWALSDGHGPHGPPRAFTLEVSLGKADLEVELGEAVRLATGRTPAVHADPEGLAQRPGGGYFVSLEGATNDGVPPALLALDAAGGLQTELPLDAKFEPSAEAGVRDNGAFEALALSPDGRTLWTATEAPLRQDGAAASFAEGGRCRLLRYRVGPDGVTPTAEHVYQTDPIPSAAAGRLGSADIGLVELLVWPDGRLLALERASVQVDGVFRNTIRLYLADPRGAPDVSGHRSLALTDAAVPKRLVMDLNDIVPRLDARHRRLDNVEGMTWGPTLDDGRRSVILVSDDNFSAHQRTVFIALAID